MHDFSHQHGMSIDKVLLASFNSLKQAVAIIDIPGVKIYFANDALCNLFEFDFNKQVQLAELNKMRKISVTMDDVDRWYKTIERQGYFSEQVEYISKTGRPFWGQITMKQLKLEQPGFCLVVIDEIGKEKETEQTIINQDNRLDALYEFAQIGIFIVNGKGEIISANPFALNLFGYAADEVKGQKVEKLIPARYHHKHIKYRERYAHHPTNRPMGTGMDLFGVKKDGTELPVEVSLSHYQFNNDDYTIAFLNDITLRKKTEAEIEKLNNELEATVEERTVKLMEAMKELERSREVLSVSLEREKELGELKTRFVSMASHEFRTPLSTVLSSAYLIEKYTGEDEQPKREKHLQRIVSSVNMLTDILNDFLSLGKIEEGKIQVRPAVFNISNMITSVIKEIKNNMKQGQQIFYSHTGPPDVRLDESLLKHIIMNLVSNAGKYSPEASRVEIKTHCGKSHITLSVKDYGMGISKEDQKHLMERFFRGANAGNIQGTGLGLHLVSKYAELMNGTVECKSELENGTEFIIKFISKPDHDEKNTAD
jgi:PAS domain S-box-containing protein